jgi:hypothetical protein
MPILLLLFSHNHPIAGCLRSILDHSHGGIPLSLQCHLFVGACMVSGNVKDGFKALLDTYLLNVISDVGHVYKVLFTLFLSGMVGMMQKSGGRMSGFTRDVASTSTNPESENLPPTPQSKVRSKLEFN